MAPAKPIARAHTYYLAHRDLMLGECKDDEELAGFLRGAWQERAAGTDPGPYDGVSAWLDEKGAVHVYALLGGTPKSLAGEALATWIGEPLTAAVAPPPPP
jgi:hypothetical protein